MQSFASWCEDVLLRQGAVEEGETGPVMSRTRGRRRASRRCHRRTDALGRPAAGRQSRLGDGLAVVRCGGGRLGEGTAGRATGRAEGMTCGRTGHLISAPKTAFRTGIPSGNEQKVQLCLKRPGQAGPAAESNHLCRTHVGCRPVSRLTVTSLRRILRFPKIVMKTGMNQVFFCVFIASLRIV